MAVEVAMELLSHKLKQVEQTIMGKTHRLFEAYSSQMAEEKADLQEQLNSSFFQLATINESGEASGQEG